jgi:hypothetical protein
VGYFDSAARRLANSRFHKRERAIAARRDFSIRGALTRERVARISSGVFSWRSDAFAVTCSKLVGRGLPND